MATEETKVTRYPFNSKPDWLRSRRSTVIVIGSQKPSEKTSPSPSLTQTSQPSPEPKDE